MKFRFIEAHRDQGPVTVLCDVLRVSAAGYYRPLHPEGTNY